MTLVKTTMTKKGDLKSYIRKITTPWGIIESQVEIFPITYIFIIFLLGLFFPFRVFQDYTLLRLWSRPEHISEIFQFLFYFFGSIISIKYILKNYKFKDKYNITFWIIFSLLNLFISIEEISFINIFEGQFYFIKELNLQNEVNIHNLKVLSPYLMHLYILYNLFMGFIGWKFLPFIECLPEKKYSLYFLFPCLFFTTYTVSTLNGNDVHLDLPSQEIFEFLTSMGIFLHIYKITKRT